MNMFQHHSNLFDDDTNTPRILIVTPFFPYPPRAGAELRYYNLIKRLSQHYNISLLTFTLSPVALACIEKMQEFCEQIVVLLKPRSTGWRGLISLAGLLLSGKPLGAKYCKDPQFSSSLKQLLTDYPFDILQIEEPLLADVIGSLPHDHLANTRTLLTFHNVLYYRERSILAIEHRPYQRLKRLLNWLSMKSWERGLVAKFDACIAMSSFDREALSSLAEGANLFVVPNGVDADAYTCLPVRAGRPRLLFVGHCGYPPNRDAILFFYDKIFGAIRESIPEVQLSIVGREPDQRILELAADPAVSVSANVEDVVPFYEEATVSIVPLRAGSGTRLKILEAMALGRPVVSTSLGCQGLEVTHGEDILIADDPKHFAQAVVNLLNNVTLRQQLILKARRLVEAKYSWDVIARVHSEVYQRLISPAPLAQRTGLG